MTAGIEQTLARLDQLSKEEETAFYQQLQEQINWLINNNFLQLVQMLYRLDVDEHQLKSLLRHQQNADAATLIANLIIERQLKKVETKNQKNKDAGISGDQRW